MIFRRFPNIKYVYEIRVRSVLGPDTFYRSGCSTKQVSDNLLSELRVKNHSLKYAVINTQKLGRSYK